MAHLLVLAALVAACTRGEPTPAPALPLAPAPAIAFRPVSPPPSAPRPPQRRDTMARAKLKAGVKLPVHGMVLEVSALRSESRMTLDIDTMTLRLETDIVGEGKKRQQRKVSPEEMTRLMALGEAAWRETPSGEPEVATDIQEDLYVLDGNDAFYVSGSPLHDIGHPDRPAAATVVARLFAARL